jgi:hypothetical protein
MLKFLQSYFLNYGKVLHNMERGLYNSQFFGFGSAKSKIKFQKPYPQDSLSEILFYFWY